MLTTHIQTFEKVDVLKLTAQFQLIRQLKHYGLAPSEWKFHSFQWSDNKKQANVEIAHREDSNLRIKGVVEKQWPRKKSLHLWHWADICWDL